VTQLASDTGRFLRIRPFTQRRKHSSSKIVAARTPRIARRYGGWVALALLAALVDSKALLAGTVGFGVYQLASQDRDRLWQQVLAAVDDLKTQLSQGQTRAWLISGAAFMGSYGAIAASTQLGSAATLALLALGGVNLATLVIVTRYLQANPQDDALQNPVLGHRAAPAEADPLDTHWRHLTASDPLKRFMAVRQLTDWGLTLTGGDRTGDLGGQGQGLKDDFAYLLDCFHLMLSQEQEPTIRTALRDALQQLSPKLPPRHLPQLGPGSAALPTLANQMQPVELRCHHPSPGGLRRALKNRKGFRAG
jgi:hypothetical protein